MGLRKALPSLAQRSLRRLGFELTRVPVIDAATDIPPDLRDTTFDHRFHSAEDTLPPGAQEYLRSDNERLRELRDSYAQLDWPPCRHSRWRDETVTGWLNLKFFRGDNIIMWHYREDSDYTGPAYSRLFYLHYLRYVMDRGGRDLIGLLGEDGAFGCWVYDYPGYPRCSRDLLESVNEMLFLDKHLSVLSTAGLAVLDIGAGYGRLAHRASRAMGGLRDYCCVDAVAESTFLCEYYTAIRQVVPPARVAPLSEVPSLSEGQFDLAVNVHSFSECRLEAVEWWMSQVDRLRVPHLFVVPNEPAGFLTTEADGSREDYLPAIESRGYRLMADTPAIDDAAIRDVLGVPDRFCLFERT